ncbi:hypothetical protein [Glutamicibacter arilaitensis]|uniref:hypothetical protein n=1 Tax=Glutamicibacter arilaitensis TaxID=256701 RepID=UPI001CB97ECE|nr:hypothetical protein [Glutamicibacter arilaitensis]
MDLHRDIFRPRPEAPVGVQIHEGFEQDRGDGAGTLLRALLGQGRAQEVPM